MNGKEIQLKLTDKEAEKLVPQGAEEQMETIELTPMTHEELKENMGLIRDMAQLMSKSAIIIMDGIPVIVDQEGNVNEVSALLLAGESDDEIYNLVKYFMEHAAIQPFLMEYAMKKATELQQQVVSGVPPQGGLILPGGKLMH